MIKIRRALLSVSDKTGLVELARFLHNRGIEICATGGTARHLAAAEVPVTEVAELTGFAEMLNGRVKTIHPAVHAALLANHRDPAHRAELERAGYAPFELAVINLYPFAKRQQEGRSDEELTEAIDIGGVAILRAAAKNHRNVVPVSSPVQYQELIAEINREDGITHATSRRWAAVAFRLTADFDARVSCHLLQSRGAHLLLDEALSLRYGENPHQEASLLGGPTAIPFTKLQGTEISYNNLLDIDTAVRFLHEIREPAAVVIKHGTPCGARTHGGVLELYRGAVAGDPQAAFGGIVGFNCEVDAVTAGTLTERFWEVVIAPSFGPDAFKILSTKPKMRVVQIDSTALKLPTWEYRTVFAGILKQQRDRLLDLGKKKIVSIRKPTEQELTDMAFASLVCKYVRSNAIVVAKEGEVYGVGAGQMSRIEACRLALKLAGDNKRDVAGAVLASDGFFPFRDTVDAAAAAGVTALVAPGGSIRDEESVAAANEHGMALLFTGTRHFRH